MSNIPDWSNVPAAWVLAIYGDYVYVGNWDSGTISKVELTTGLIVNSNWASEVISQPNGITIDSSGNYMYVTSRINGTISKIDFPTGTIINSSWVFGLNFPSDLVIDNTETYIYVTNSGNGQISKIRISDGFIFNSSWVSGLSNPVGLTIDSTGTYMYVANLSNGTISRIQMSDQTITTWVSGLDSPNYLTINNTNNYMYVTNKNNGTISRIKMSDPTMIVPNLVSGLLKYTGGLVMYGTCNIYVANYTDDPPPIVCFKEGSKILTDKGYICIQDLQKGDLVKTLKHEYKSINMIGKREIYNLSLKDRIKDQLYKCSNEQFPEIFEPLIITGCHAILIDNCVTHKQIEQTKEVLGNTYFTDDKYRMPACIDERTTVYEVEGKFMIYHIALDCDDYYMNYGIYANGLLVETCSKRYLKELSNMELINL